LTPLLIIYDMKTLILAGGGTAGHVTPLLAVLPLVKDRFDKIIYIGSGKSIEQTLIAPTGVEIRKISPPALIRSLTLKNLTIPFKLFNAINECERILKTSGASVVFSKGGYCALPVCLAAFKLKIPVTVHESDLTVGLANKLTLKRAAIFFTSFEQTAKKYGGVYCGPPLRSNLFNGDKDRARKQLGIKSKKPVLLVTGGSQGSSAINDAVFNNLGALCEKFNVIHLCGKNKKPTYSAINGYFPFEFIDMKAAISACDFCITRGGSNTLFELLYAKKPCIAVPLKKGSRGDQIKNVLHFEDKKALFYLDEDLLDKKLLTALDHLLIKKNYYIENIRGLNLKNGADEIAKKLIELSK